MRRFLLFCLLALVVTSPLFSETFLNPIRIPTNGDPLGIRIADLNNDGLLDGIYGLAATASNPATIQVVLGQAGGTFLPLAPMSLPASTTPNCAVVDVNGDHKPDLVCPNTTPSQDSLLTFFGNGDGTFQPAILSYQVAAATLQPQFNILNSSDLNNDGKADLILNGPDIQTVAVLLGDGAGHFSLKYTLPTGPSTIDTLTVADVNSDGKPDIIRSFGPDVLTGNGDGTFTPLTPQTGTSQSPTYSNCFAKKDIDGDGHLDAVCSSGTSRFSVLHGNLDGSFNTSSPLSAITVSNPHDTLQSAAVEDFNHDGILDIATYSSEGLLIWFGKSGPSYLLSAAYTVGVMDVFAQSRTVFADANNDGYTDILTGGPDGVYISFGHPDGTFDAPPAFFSGLSVTRATVADFNNDGIPDTVTSDPLGVNISLGKGDGTFAASTLAPTPTINLIYTWPFPLLHGDFDGDGKQDLIVQGTMSNNISPQAYFLHGNGDATFAPAVTIPYVVGGEPATIGTNSRVADLNRDGRDDLISADRTFLHTRMSLPGGGFSSTFASPIPDEIAVGTFPPFTVADFDRDGIPDVAVGLKNIYFLHGKGDGTFAAPGPAITVPRTPNFVTDIASADFDGDGRLDLAVLEQFTTPPFQSLVFVYYGNGDGTFASPITLIPLHSGLSVINIADFNRDGLPDLLLSCGGGCVTSLTGLYPVNVLHAQPNRTFSQPDTYVGGTLPSNTIVSDLNRDGFPDLLFANGAGFGNAFTVLLNQPSGPITIAPTTTAITSYPNPSTYGQPITFTATISSSSSAAGLIPTGTVTFTGPFGATTKVPVTNGVATFVDPISGAIPEPVGTLPLIATYSGDSNFAPSTSPTYTQIINPAASTTTLTATPTTAYQNQTVTFNTTVSGLVSPVISPTGQPIPPISFYPTGNVQLFDGANLLTTVTLTNGAASFATALLSAGTHSITAHYPGSSNLGPSVSSAVTVTILPSDFTLAFNPPTISLVTGHHTTLTLTASSVGNFADTVHLSASNLPPWVTLRFTPTDLKLTAGNSATASIYLDTDAVIGYISQSKPSSPLTPGLSAATAAAFALILAPFTVRRRRRLAMLLTLTLAAALLASTSGCSGKYPDSTAPGTYALQITATGTQTGLTHTVTLPLTVTK